MASTHTACVPARQLDADVRRCGRAVVRVPGCKGEFSVEPGKMTFHDGEGMNYVMYVQRRIEFDDVLCTVETPRYSVRATQTGFEGKAVFTVTDNYDRAPTPFTQYIATSPVVHSSDDFLDAMGAVTSLMRGSSVPYTPLNKKRRKVLLLC